MPTVKASIKTEPYKIEIKSQSGNTVIADEPLDKGGKDLGFSPKELLIAALSACTSATLRMYIEHKGWDVPEINVETELIEGEKTTTLNRKLHFNGILDEAQKERLIKIANACPVHKILAGDKDFHTEIV